MIHMHFYMTDEDFTDEFGEFFSQDEWFSMCNESGISEGLIPIYSEAYQRVESMAITEEQIEYLTTDGRNIVKACIKKFGKNLDQDDLEQECMLSVIRAMQLYDPSRTDAKLSTYIWAAVENKIKMLLRKTRTGQAHYERYGRRPAWMIPKEKFLDPSFEKFEEWDEYEGRRTWLARAIEGLPEGHRIVMQLTLAGVYQDNIGLVIGKGQSQVSRLKFSAVKILKRKLEEDIKEGRFFIND